MTRAIGILEWPLNTLARPERLVSGRTFSETRRLTTQLLEASWIVLFLFGNLVLYAAPLTLAGYGVGGGISAPAAFVNTFDPVLNDPAGVWEFLVALSRNSAFLLVATLLTFFTFHVGVILSRSSHGILQSLRAVAYSTGVYLAVMFSLVWYVSTAPGIAVADDILIAVQAEFFYYFIDLLNVGLGLPGGRPSGIPTEGLKNLGLMILALLIVSAVYFLYVLYVAARVGHNANRIEAMIATGFVLVSPALYVIGIILYSINF